MSSLLDLIVEYILVADVPEILIKDFLPGDDCLDEDTVELIFTTKYCRDGRTYMDEKCTVLHSFDDEPTASSESQMSNGLVHYYWYFHFNGKLHRKHDKPALICNNGSRYWYVHGQLHRENDQPAWVESHTWSPGDFNRNGDDPDTWDIKGTLITQKWYHKGKIHRDGDQPAVIQFDGQEEWFRMGKRHRQ